MVRLEGKEKGSRREEKEKSWKETEVTGGEKNRITRELVPISPYSHPTDLLKQSISPTRNL